MSFKKSYSYKSHGESILSGYNEDDNSLSIESNNNWKKEYLRDTDGNAYDMPWVDNVNHRLMMDWLDYD